MSPTPHTYTTMWVQENVYVRTMALLLLLSLSVQSGVPPTGPGGRAEVYHPMAEVPSEAGSSSTSSSPDLSEPLHFCLPVHTASSGTFQFSFTESDPLALRCCDKTLGIRRRVCLVSEGFRSPWWRRHGRPSRPSQGCLGCRERGGSASASAL